VAQIELTEQALALTQRHAPVAFAHFEELIRSIALKSSGLGKYTNISHSDLPGSFVCTVVREPYFLADSLINEMYPNRFLY
jgi:hypothetical protein